MHRIELRGEIPAPPAAVWEVLADHRGWAKWAGIREAVLRNEGYPAPNGLGATRVFRQSGIAIEEEITFFDPPRRMEYRISGGAPLRDHHGEMILEPSPEGTRLTWRVAFRPLIPGTGALLRWGLDRGLGRIIARLAAYPFPAEPAATSSPAG